MLVFVFLYFFSFFMTWVVWNHMWDNHFNYSNCKESGEHSWRSGESTRLPPMWPGFNSRTRRHKWAEFVDSPFCSERFFSGYSAFPLSQKPKFDLI